MSAYKSKFVQKWLTVVQLRFFVNYLVKCGTTSVLQMMPFMRKLARRIANAKDEFPTIMAHIIKKTVTLNQIINSKVMEYQINQLRDYSSLFSRSEALSWLKMDFTSINYKIERYDEKWSKRQNLTYLDYLKHVYSILADSYQNEYIFKNEFLNTWLIKELGETNSQIFSEFRVGNSIADLVMFNGCSKIFEIKTEFDSDSRLTLQLQNYEKAFNQIFIIIPKSKLKIYEKQKSSIGIITYNPKTDDSFSLFRNANVNFEIDPSTIMSILHTNEYKSIVKKHFGNLPLMTSFNQYKVCSELICQIPLNELNNLFISTIKKRSSSNALSSRYYKEFNQLFLALRMNQKAKSQMIESLKTTIQV